MYREIDDNCGIDIRSVSHSPAELAGCHQGFFFLLPTSGSASVIVGGCLYLQTVAMESMKSCIDRQNSNCVTIWCCSYYNHMNELLFCCIMTFNLDFFKIL